MLLASRLIVVSVSITNTQGFGVRYTQYNLINVASTFVGLAKNVMTYVNRK